MAERSNCGAAGFCADSASRFPFVVNGFTTGKTVASNVPKRPSKFSAAVDYGLSGPQIEQVKGNFLHESGYLGKNIIVGVLDAGFLNVDVNPAFDSLRLQGRLLGTKDFVGGSDVFRGNFHGGNVLSIMAGNLPQNYLGTAPEASYWLIRQKMSKLNI